jgi:transposase
VRGFGVDCDAGTTIFHACTPPGRVSGSTVHAIFTRWRQDGDLHALHNDLREKVRQAEGRQAEPTAAIIDSQSVRAAETVGAGSRGYDAGKKVPGRKRHVIVDCLGLLLVVLVTAASVQDRDGARPALKYLREVFEKVTLVWADGGYAGELVAWARRKLRLTLQIVKRRDDVRGFVVLPRRWVVERTLAWIFQRRRCVRDYERLPEPAREPRLDDRRVAAGCLHHGRVLGDQPVEDRPPEERPGRAGAAGCPSAAWTRLSAAT